MSINTRLTEVFESPRTKEVPFDDSSKFILFSDCHRGDNSWSDDFAHNQNIFFHALNHYYKEGFTYIEIGDGDELWEHRRYADVTQAHSHIFWLMSKFHREKRLYLIWGNHNRRWKKPKNVKRQLYWWYTRRGREPLFNGIEVHEGLILRYADTDKRIFLVHGHQGQLLNDSLWPVGRFVVRSIWKPLQLLGVKDPTSPAKNFKTRTRVEKGIKEWAAGEKRPIVIVGHTHRSVFPALGETPYFNIGSCVHPRCITGIEIENGSLVLVRWFINANESDRTLCIDREEKVGPSKLQDFF